MRASQLCLLAALAVPACAQTPATPLRLSDATALALKNHPQIQAAQDESLAQNRRIVETRAGYYPTVAGEITASGANQMGRIGAGYLSDSSLFDRVGDGVEINQLISDFGRTANLVAQSKLLAGASEKTVEATRYDIILRVNQAYYGALRAQAL